MVANTKLQKSISALGGNFISRHLAVHSMGLCIKCLDTPAPLQSESMFLVKYIVSDCEKVPCFLQHLVNFCVCILHKIGWNVRFLCWVNGMHKLLIFSEPDSTYTIDYQIFKTNWGCNCLACIHAIWRSNFETAVQTISTETPLNSLQHLQLTQALIKCTIFPNQI